MRIITGLAKGMRLKTPKGLDTRPTSDRVRESVFSILGDLSGLSVLDLFAGTGSLGLEALSRGAALATFVDSRTGSLVFENAKITKLISKTEILKMDVFDALRRLKKKQCLYQLVFCDPPYHKGLSQRVFCDVSPLLSDGGILVLEVGKEEADFDNSALELKRAVNYGHTTNVMFYKKIMREEAL